MRTQPFRRTPALVLAALLALTAVPPLAAVEPVGDPFPLPDTAPCLQSSVDLARLADGGFVAVWVQEAADAPFGPLRVHARLFDADATARGPAFAVSTEETASQRAVAPAVATGPGGGFLVAWGSVDGADAGVRARPYTGGGLPVVGPLDLGPTSAPESPDVVREGDRYRVVWTGSSETALSALVDADGDATAATGIFAITAVPPTTLAISRPALASDAGGFTLLLQVHASGPFGLPGRYLLARRYGSGDAVELPLALSPEDPADGGAVGTDAAGNSVVAWRESTGPGQPVGLRVQRFAPDGTALGAPAWVTGPGEWELLSGAALAVAADGSFQVAWSGRRTGDAAGDALFVAAYDDRGEPLTTSAPLSRGATLLPLGGPEPAPALIGLGNGAALLAWQAFPPLGAPGIPPCDSGGVLAQRLRTPSGQDLLLHDGRFAVRVAWQDPYSVQERAGLGVPESLGGASGWFWFFRRGNAELVVKVLDGRPVNGHWWVFHGGLSTVAYQLTVTDLDTDATWSYDKPPFERVSAADTTAFPDGDGAAAAPLTTVTARTHPDSAAGPCTDPTLPVPVRPGLCLHDRFEVEAELDDPLLHRDPGGEVLSSDTGRLWFFRQDNTELLVKVLDGRPVNGRWWVFSGALTNVGYTLVVRDTESGEEQRYPVPAGNFESIADTAAF